MTLFKVDASFHCHPKVFAADLAAIGLWARAGSYIAAHQTGGFVSDGFVTDIPDGETLARGLVQAGLWKTRPGGYEMLSKVSSVPGGRARILWGIERTDVRKRIPAWIREHVMERDGHACVECSATGDLCLDHVYPWSLGGPDTVENLRVLCRSCNSSKGARV